MPALTDADFELLMLLVDGELAGEPARRAEAEALVAAHPEAREFVEGWQAGKVALREAVLTQAADLTRIRGRVMPQLPAEPRAVVQAAEPGWWQRLGLGKLGLAAGVAAAAVLALAVAWQPAVQQDRPAGAVADCGDTECPTVIIEDTEVDEGGMMVRHGEQPGEATIIWHGAPAAGGMGEG